MPPPSGCLNPASWPPTVSTSQELKVRVTKACTAYPTFGRLVPVVLCSKMNTEVTLKRSLLNPDLGNPADVYFQPCTATCWPGWVVWSQRMGKRTGKARARQAIKHSPSNLASPAPQDWARLGCSSSRSVADPPHFSLSSHHRIHLR